MDNRMFIEEYAKLTGVDKVQAEGIVKYLRALIVAGVHAHGSVTIFNLGTFTNKWWIPKGALKGLPPANRLVFTPCRPLSNRMSVWAGCPGYTKAQLVAMRKAAKSLAAPSPQSPDADDAPAESAAASEGLSQTP